MASTNPSASEKPAPKGGARRLGSGRGQFGEQAAPRLAVAMERALPYSEDAEIAVLGSMLISPQDAAPLACARLNELHFYKAAHQVIFRELSAMQDAMQAIDPVTLQTRLLNKNQLEEVGGPSFLADLVTRVPTAANVEHYINIVAEKHLLRQLIEAAHNVIGGAFDQQDDVKSFVDQVEQQIFEITAEKSTGGARAARDVVKEAMLSIEHMYDKRGSVTGLATGYRDLDKLTSGLHASNMIVIAGRPSMGKTALAMNIAENVAIDQKLPVGVFSLEMSAEELVVRMLCSRAMVNLRSIRDGFPSEKDHHRLTSVASHLMKAPLYVDDSASLTVTQVRARARRLKSQHDIKLLVIDYMQLMRAPSRRADSSRQAEVADISAGIKALAKELRIPVIVLSQLNRQPDARDEGQPRLADLRESGAIEQDADVVGLLVRPEEYHRDDPDKKEELRGKATLIIAKQRNGPTGNVDLTFRSDFTRFEDAARVEQEDVPGFGGGEE